MRLRLMMLVALLILPATSAGPVDHAPSAWVALDKAVYRSGDVLTARFYNPGNASVYFSVPAPFDIRDPTGTVPFYSPSSQPSLGVTIPPGKTYNMTWNLRVDPQGSAFGWNGELPPGDYRFVVSFYPGTRVGPYTIMQEESAPFRACTAPREGAEGVADRAFLAQRCA